MEHTIFLREVLHDMKKLDSLKNPVRFDVSVREFNRQNKSGGTYRQYKNCMLLQPAKNSQGKKPADASKNPRHWENKTRNIKLENGEIKKINILYIITYNGKKVVY